MPNPNLNALNKKPAWLTKQKEKVSALTESNFENVPLDMIDLNPDNKNYNANDTEESIKELADSIAYCGLQQPLVLHKNDNGRFTIIAGERRFKAVSMLNWKAVTAKVYTNLSFTKKAVIKNHTNLLPRKLSSETYFKGYLDVLNALKSDGVESSEVDRKQIAEMIDSTSQKVKEFEIILKNVNEEKLNKFEEGEITYHSLKELAEQQEKINRQQRKLNDAIEVFAKAREDTNATIYADDNNFIYFVSPSQGKYIVKLRNFKSNIPGYDMRSDELPPSEDITTMQTYLDKYADVHGLRICNEHEYLEKIKNSSSDDESEKKENQNPKIVINKSLKIEDIQQNTNEDNDNDSKTIETHSNTLNKTDTYDKINDEEEQPSDLSKDKRENDNTGNEFKQKHQNKPDIEEEQINILNQPNLDNINAKDIIYTGQIVGTDEMIKGSLVKSNNRMYIVRGNVSIEKPLEQNEITVYSAHLLCCEILPTTLKIEIKDQ